jgi:hypothetical protein
MEREKRAARKVKGGQRNYSPQLLGRSNMLTSAVFSTAI